ncbi:MAG: hypothetical protein GXO29_06135 [Thermotogae bacterium]|nr:hypothetical protein [Thermotogota bacterium]
MGCRSRGAPDVPPPPSGDGGVAVVWEGSLGREVLSVPAALNDSEVVVLTEGGGVFSLGAGGKLRLLFETDEPITFGPVVSGDTILFGTFYGYLLAFAPDGRMLLRDSLGSASAVRGITVCDGYYVAVEDGHLFATGDGGVRWVGYLGDWVLFPATCLPRRGVVVPTISGRLLMYDSSGNLVWLVEGLDYLPSAPSYDGARIAVASPEGRVLFLSPDGLRETEFSISASPMGEVLASEGRYVVATTSGRLVSPGEWEVEVPLDAPPLLTDVGIVAVGGGLLRLLSYDGSVMDSVEIGEGEWLSPLPVEGGLIVVSREGRVLFVGGEWHPAGGWPTVRGDAARRGVPTSNSSAL